MKRIVFILLLLLSCSYSVIVCYANDEQPGGSQCVGNNLIPLHVEGRYFKDEVGNVVVLHGFAQTYSPWFNERCTKWNNYDVKACLEYNQGMIDKVLDAGWKVNFVRLHMDPYWSNTPNVDVDGESDIHAFDFERFKKYLAEVFIPMAEYAQAKGLYIVMRPPGVCPKYISIGDDYQKYLLKVWDYVSQQPELKNNGAVMFELANEPVYFTVTKGKSEAEEMTMYMQAIVDKIRENCNNILLVPGLGWQARYQGFAEYPIKGDNIGFAVHCYPGWYNGGYTESGDVPINYENFRAGWRSQIGPVSAKYPIIVTETDWSPSDKYGDMTFAHAKTGVVGDNNFGANFKQIVDDDNNVSWLIFAWQHFMAEYDGVPATSASNTTFYNDPDACLWPCFHWFEDYANSYYPSKTKYEQTLTNPYYIDPNSLFPLTDEGFDPNIWEKGSFNATTGDLKTGPYGFGGWEYAAGVDLSDYKYLVVELNSVQNCGASFRLFDESSYWSSPSMTSFDNKTRIVIDLHNQKKIREANNVKTEVGDLKPSHIFRAGIWTTGNGSVSIKDVYLSNDGTNKVSTGINHALSNMIHMKPSARIYNLQGQVVANGMEKLQSLPHGIYIINGKKVAK